MSDTTDFAAIMPQVAELVLGEFMGPKNKHMSSASEWRWGTKGGISVDLPKGTWFDHEDNTGGGVLDLLRAFKGKGEREAIDWLVEQGLVKPRERPNGSASHHANGASPQGKFAGFMDDWPVATYQYFDERGNLAYEVLKFAKTAPRRFMQRRPHPQGGWIWGLQAGTYGKTRSGDWFKAKEGKKYETEETFDEARWYLYRRAEVLKAIAEGRPVHLVEGEKDADTMGEWGFTATTNQGGAKNWKPELTEDLAGADIVILHDNDDAGRGRVLLRGAELSPIARSVRVLDLALYWPDMPEKADVSDWKDKAGGSAEALAALLKKATMWTPTRPREFGAYYHDEIDGPGIEYDYLVDGLLTARGRSVIGGPSGSGKSFLALHAAYCVARGLEFFGHHVERGGVIYQAGEGGLGMKKRQKAYRKHFQVPDGEDIPLVVLPAKVDLFAREGDTDRLIGAIKAIKITMAVPLRAVFIDTLATATIGADENSGRDMSVVLSNIARIEHECGVHVCLVHHMNADGKKLRGHTSIQANVDTVILVTQDETTRIRTAKLTKQKDDEDGLKIPFTLASVAIGTNPKTGRDVTSCVVLTVSEKDALKKEAEQFGFSTRPSEEKILIPLFKAIGRYGQFITSEADGPREAVGKHVVKLEYYLDVAAEMDAADEDKQKARDRLRKQFDNNNKFLLKAGVIGFHRPFIWWTGKPIRGYPDTFPEHLRNRKNPGNIPEETGKNPGNEAMQELFDDPGIQL